MTWRRHWKNRVLQGGKRGGVKLGSSVFVLGRERLKRERCQDRIPHTAEHLSLSPPSLHWGSRARMRGGGEGRRWGCSISK